jgi:7,8-dihydropterin-6-yl-methyl-4-(beta-D-ribofuranosyl)aminobenzene 5'-phosphate synthase
MSAPQTLITMLVDNQAGDGLASEHGLSLLIEADDRRILLDTGQGGALESNVPALGVDLSRVDVLVLSHGHFDHTGGVPQVLREAPDIEVYCHPGVLQTRYSIRDGQAKPIGIPRPSLEALERLPAERLHPVRGSLMLSPKIWVTAPIPRATAYEDTGGPFFLDPHGEQPDTIEDDLALWIETGQGLVVCLGCAHAGVVNTLDHIRAVTKGARVRALVGGFHLGSADRERMDETVSALRDLGPDLVVPCHCTGADAVAAIRDALGERVGRAAAGMTFRF